ncbi:hypothetical protein [Subtercola sp. RTI3]|uniref:hypothetical protein n=1 Tax=Subtercola sp. RTI3 TaxID=3048639 RepID=UPI002B235A18|nr:hypothetical protein [Subtercola sp. RTI3]MEA9985977.1 hypothetical protein [Subtercola sp. RTI3]
MTATRVEEPVERMCSIKTEEQSTTLAGSALIHEGRARFIGGTTPALENKRQIMAERVVVSVGGHSRPFTAISDPR